MRPRPKAWGRGQRVPRPRPRPEVTRPRPRPKLWPWCQFGLEALTSLRQIWAAGLMICRHPTCVQCQTVFLSVCFELRCWLASRAYGTRDWCLDVVKLYSNHCSFSYSFCLVLTKLGAHVLCVPICTKVWNRFCFSKFWFQNVCQII